MYTPPKKKGPRSAPIRYAGKIRLRSGDLIRVISGKDKGKEGTITRVIPATGKIVVEGLNIVIKHQKPRQQAAPGAQQESGRIEMSMPLHICKVQLIDKDAKNAVTRIGVKLDASGNRVRYAKKSGGVIDNG
ncbi:MAG: 50S ribosomal protein L24 [Capsulimonas sp.]|jgi:large subunit ribosomal protein L24|uniref:50S ribosomal protein L24 n=1 Tax=Capsulimonas sp. TaxID=2494211 RepID=UPI003267CACF|nr:ribosomal protein [Capsulimonas sp.]